ncbi:MAG: FMN-binding negative transcriptional regulator [Sphingomonadales bacterium]|nr:MAG: FMN-binding negative transcriptional regulator [Sphingomonadales bacterium]
MSDPILDRPVFERFVPDDVRALIASYPLAWMCASSASLLEAAVIPLVGVYDDGGRLCELVGHFPRRSELYAVLRQEPRATFLLCGPDSYISPAHAGKDDWAPTWNFAQLRIEAEVDVDARHTEPALNMLIDQMEASQPLPWSVTALGERYDGMLEHIIGFRARPLQIRGRFKLGQDEDAETLGRIMATLPADPIRVWMRRFAERR